MSEILINYLFAESLGMFFELLGNEEMQQYFDDETQKYWVEMKAEEKKILNGRKTFEKYEEDIFNNIKYLEENNDGKSEQILVILDMIKGLLPIINEPSTKELKNNIIIYSISEINAKKMILKKNTTINFLNKKTFEILNSPIQEKIEAV